MKRNYIYLACMTVCMFALFAISSCSNEMDMPSSKIEHLQNNFVLNMVGRRLREFLKKRLINFFCRKITKRPRNSLNL